MATEEACHRYYARCAVFRFAGQLLLRPVLAAAAVALLIALPLVVLGEISDDQARARAEAEMFESGAGIAERAGSAIEKRAEEYAAALYRMAAGDLRQAVVRDDTRGVDEAAFRAIALTYRDKTYLAPRVVVTDGQGTILTELKGADQPGRTGTIPGDVLFVTSDASRGRRDAVALDLMPGLVSSVQRTTGVTPLIPCEERRCRSRPYLADRGDRGQPVIAIAAPIWPTDTRRTLLGLLLLELPIDLLREEVTPLLRDADDIYVVDQSGVLAFSVRPPGATPLADMTGSAVVAKSIRSQPVTSQARGPVTLREYAPDPLSGNTRAFATAVIGPWHVFVVPDRTAVLNVDATLAQLRLARLGIAVILVVGTFGLAMALRAVRRQRAALAEALEQQTATADVLKTISRAALDLPAVLQSVVAAAARLCNADVGWLNQADDHVGKVPGESPDPARFTGRWSRVGAYYGRTEELEGQAYAAFTRVKPIGGLFPMYRQTATSLAILDRKVINVPDWTMEPDLRASGFARAMNVRALLVVPLMRESDAIGAIALARLTTRPFTEREVALAQTFADQAVIAIENARLFNETVEKSRELEAASRHKSEFLANMSHELRTPLNAVIGFSDVLEQGMAGALSDKQAEYIRDISSSGKHLLDLVNEILDLSKVEAGRMELEPSEFSATDAVLGTFAFVRERAARHGIELAADVPADLGTLVADERKVRQVLLNLLSNAVKFTPDGGWIGVSARRENGEITVSVRDTGIGIAPEDQATVFEEFQQVGKPTDRSREGTGLGLTLAKRFVELHDGRIWFESEVGKGTTFTFALPAAAKIIV